MTVSALQQALRSGQHTLTGLERDLHLHLSRHQAHPNLVGFKYDMLESPMQDPVCRNARGIVLDEDRGWEVVAWPFNKFFNSGEGLADTIDWDTAKVQEKVDGSLMILYYYRDPEDAYSGQWLVASSGRADAGGNINGSVMTFAQLFWRTWGAGLNRSGGLLNALQDLDRGSTYMFELTTPWNRVVCGYGDAENLTYLGRRDLRTGLEVRAGADPDYHLSWPAPAREFPLQSLEDVARTFEQMDPMQQEGYVIVDADFHRLKVKHPGYVALHHLKAGLTPRAVLEVVRSGETAEVIAAFPEWRRLFDEVRADFEALVLELEQQYETVKDIVEQKQFALMVMGKQAAPGQELMRCRCSSALFSRRQGLSIREHLRQLHLDRVAAILGLDAKSFPIPEADNG